MKPLWPTFGLKGTGILAPHDVDLMRAGVENQPKESSKKNRKWRCVELWIEFAPEIYRYV
jgi:hypothetical protein